MAVCELQNRVMHDQHEALRNACFTELRHLTSLSPQDIPYRGGLERGFQFESWDIPAREGKDGNPLNEVRMLCNSLVRNEGVLCADKTIKDKPETSVLKLRIGNEIAVNEARFQLFFETFFAEIQEKFS